jgi:hypothetical protein
MAVAVDLPNHSVTFEGMLLGHASSINSTQSRRSHQQIAVATINARIPI